MAGYAARALLLVVGLFVFGVAAAPAQAGFSIRCGKCCICPSCCDTTDDDSGGWDDGGGYIPEPRYEPPPTPGKSAATKRYEAKITREKEKLASELVRINVKRRGSMTRLGRDAPPENRHPLDFRWGRPDFGDSPFSPLTFAPEGTTLPSDRNNVRLQQGLAILATALEWEKNNPGASPEDAHFLASQAFFAMLGHPVQVSLETAGKPLFSIKKNAREEMVKRIETISKTFQRLKKFKEQEIQDHKDFKELSAQLGETCRETGHCATEQERIIWAERNEKAAGMTQLKKNIQGEERWLDTQTQGMDDEIIREIIMLPADATQSLSPDFSSR
jgi:hypothetical protein